MSYQSIFTIRLEHDYYIRNVCRAIRLGVSSEGMSLMKRRGLMFRQTEVNQWVIIGDSEGAGVFDGDDVLELEMILSEPKFVYITDWKDYQTRYAYRLDMPCKKDIVEADQVMFHTDVRRKGNILGSIYIQLSNQMFEKAKIGEAISNTLTFHAPKLRWEYILISRNEDSNRNLQIEDNHNQIAFGQMEKLEIESFSEPVFRTITKSSIAMKEHYDFIFSLVEIVRKEPLMKRVLIRQLDYPPIGAFISEDPNIIRQIVYY